LLSRAVLGITQARMRDAVERSDTSEVRGAFGEGFLAAHAGQQSCPRVAALMHPQDARVNRKRLDLESKL